MKTIIKQQQLEDYFLGDKMASDVWVDKYAMKDKDGNVLEHTPADMHLRMAKEFARIETKYVEIEFLNAQTDTILGRDSKMTDFNRVDKLSKFGQKLFNRRVDQSESDITNEIFSYFDHFSRIIPQGSIMSNLGNKYVFGSLSNCFGIESPLDSYGGIMKADQELVQLMKRRGGVGMTLDNLRYNQANVTNAAKTSSGVPSFAERFSNSTREVAQEGRRGALMLLLSCKHPDIFKFVTMKDDRTKVTGANVSVMLTDEFMEAVKDEETFICTFPVNTDKVIPDYWLQHCNFNEMSTFEGVSFMMIHAKELFDLIVDMAHKNGEPGIAFIDRIKDYCPDGVYEQYAPTVCNPCFHPDTMVETEHGRMKIKDMTYPMRVYSMGKDGCLVMKQASSSFISKKNTKTLKITLRNGNNIQVTEEHKLFVHNKGWVEAKNLKLDDKLGHLCRGRRGYAYSGVYLTTDSKGKDNQIMEHRLICGITDETFDVHHKDRNTYNNKLSNLQVLLHEEHCLVTSIEDNPQTHQIRNNSGAFITHENSRKGAKTIVPLPESLKTNIRNQYSSCIVNIEEGDTTDVYDIQVEDTHCLIANNIIAHNCGEQWFSADETCRLIAQNYFTIVDNPFTGNAVVNLERLYDQSYMQQRLGDDLVDLEIEHIDRIIDKILDDPEDISIKQVELNLWRRIRVKAEEGRRTGGGFTGLGDMLAALGLQYGSNEAREIIELVSKKKMEAELDATIDMAILRGTFTGWDKHREFIVSDIKNLNKGMAVKLKGSNNFYQMLLDEFPEQAGKMWKYGRRNTSWSTVAPTGTVSLMTQTTSGLEPLFKAYYIRRKKIVPGVSGTKVDFVDQSGDSWQEYVVLHPKFKQWMKVYSDAKTDEEYNYRYNNMMSQPGFKDSIEFLFKQSPWYGSEANNIDWESRIEIQSIIQKYTSNAISSTINLPEDVDKSVVKNIYLSAYKKGLKGVTVYREGSRTGVLIDDNKRITVDKFGYNNALKRPKELEAHYYWGKNGYEYAIIVGLLDNKPYEIFAFANPLIQYELKGKIIKHSSGVYSFKSASYTIEHLELSSDHKDEILLTRWVSLMLRHGANPKFIADQVEKSQLNIISFPRIISRILKLYVKDGGSTTKCPSCSAKLVYEEGCKNCKECGYSAC